MRRYTQNFETNGLELVQQCVTVQTVDHLPMATRPTFHIPVRFPGVARTHYALVDPGSQVTLITSGLAEALHLI